MVPVFLATRLRLMESTLSALDGLTARRRPSRAAHLTTGLRGERAAFFWLRRHGYIVVGRAWHSSRAPGDIDLIAWLPGSNSDTQDHLLCFIEVKTRTSRAVAPAEAAVDERKRRTLRRLARHYLRQLPNREVPTRFDILSIYCEAERPADFEHFPNAFGWSEAER